MPSNTVAPMQGMKIKFVARVLQVGLVLSGNRPQVMLTNNCRLHEVPMHDSNCFRSKLLDAIRQSGQDHGRGLQAGIGDMYYFSRQIPTAKISNLEHDQLSLKDMTAFMKLPSAAVDRSNSKPVFSSAPQIETFVGRCLKFWKMLWKQNKLKSEEHTTKTRTVYRVGVKAKNFP